MCSPIEVDTHRKINLQSPPLSPETQKGLDNPCEEYKDIFLFTHTKIGHTKLFTMDIDTRCHLPIAKKPNTNP